MLVVTLRDWPLAKEKKKKKERNTLPEKKMKSECFINDGQISWTMMYWPKNKKQSKTLCRDPGLFRTRASSPDLNQGPSDLQSDALPTELSRQLVVRRPLQKVFYHGNNSFLKILNRSLVAQLIIDKLSIKLNYPVVRPLARNLRKRGGQTRKILWQAHFANWVQFL